MACSYDALLSTAWYEYLVERLPPLLPSTGTTIPIIPSPEVGQSVSVGRPWIPHVPVRRHGLSREARRAKACRAAEEKHVVRRQALAGTQQHRAALAARVYIFVLLHDTVLQ